MKTYLSSAALLAAFSALASLALAGPGALPLSHAKPDASTSPVGYKPAQVKHAYGFDLLNYGGSGRTIAIVSAYSCPTAQSDLNVFSTQFALPQTTIKIIYGGVTPAAVDGTWALETSLDLQWAHALAPKASLILAVAASSSWPDLIAAVDAAVKAGANIVSMSWGGAEFTTETTYESHFQKSGVTFVAASGDKGAGTSWPACSPSVVAVGGTTLYLNSAGNLTAPEKGWTGSGGGFSSAFARPAYQTGWQTNAKRAIPDVSILGDPNTGVTIYDSTPYNGQKGWFQIGGTSAGTVMWAALIALADEQRLLAGSVLLTGSNASLYTLAGSVNASKVSLYSTYFFDVTTGSNGGYSATAKFDEVTGLGTPVAPNVAVSLK